MYADDLILLSPSLCELQNMLNMCCSELALLDLQVNVKKCSAIRIGNRYKNKCTDLTLNGLKFLGQLKLSIWESTLLQQLNLSATLMLQRLNIIDLQMQF